MNFLRSLAVMENNCLQFDTDIPALFKYQKSISILIKDKKLHFILDFREHSILNMKLDLDSDLKQGNLR